MGSARSFVHSRQLISQVVDVVESRSVTLGSTVALEVGRINVRSFGHQPLGDVLVPARMFAISMRDKCYKPRRRRGPTVRDDATTTAAQLDRFNSRHLNDLPSNQSRNRSVWSSPATPP